MLLLPLQVFQMGRSAPSVNLARSQPRRTMAAVTANRAMLVSMECAISVRRGKSRMPHRIRVQTV